MDFYETIKTKCKNRGLRDPQIYSLILQYIALNTGELITPTVISANLKETFGLVSGISHHTAAKYLNALVGDELVLKVGRKYLRKDGYRPDILSANCYVNNPKLFEDLAAKNREAFEEKERRSGINEFELALGRTKFANALFSALTLEERATLTAGRIDFFINTKHEGKRVSVLLDFLYEREGQEVAYIFLDAPLVKSLNGDQKLFHEYLRALDLRAKEVNVVFVDPFNPSMEWKKDGEPDILGLDLALAQIGL